MSILFGFAIERGFALRNPGDGKVGQGLTFHGIRSTVATELREAGVDLRTIADLLGQNTEQMARHYSKEADVSANVKDAAEKLERARETKLAKTDERESRKS